MKEPTLPTDVTWRQRGAASVTGGYYYLDEYFISTAWSADELRQIADHIEWRRGKTKRDPMVCA